MLFSRSHSTLRQLFASITTLMLVFTLLPLSRTSTVHAFMPTGLAAIALAFSPLSSTHTSMTYRVIEDYDKALFGISEPTKKMQDARTEIIDANVDVDNFRKPQFKKSASHFDGENFVGSQTRLKQYKQNVKINMDRKKVKRARFFLGQALHTLQDFYSHSNWVELNNTEHNAALGRTVPPRNPLRTTKTCTDCVRDTCTDCYDHKTNLTNLTTTEVTTGYYDGDDRRKPNVFKCSHGGATTFSLDKSGKGKISNGINKDTRDCNASPHYNLHGKAARLAEAATKDYLDQIKELIGEAKMKLLLGGGPTLAFAVDTTGSMGGIINRVKQQITQTIDARIGTDEEPSKYILVDFNDPDVGPVTVTDDPNVFKAALNALVASGGGDCPERAMTGMLQAVNEMDNGGDLMMFTDASSNDGHLTGTVEALALSKDVKIIPVAFGSCSPIDPGYIRLASSTGGQIFVLSPNEAGNVTKLADFMLRANAVDLLTVSGSLPGTGKTYTIPVDSTMSSVTFSVSGTTGVVLRQPDGTVVQPTDANMSTVLLSTGVIKSITNPADGAWQVTLNGSGDFSLRTLGESTLNFSSFDFVEMSGRALHEDFFPISGLPPANKATQAKAIISSSASTAQFELRAVDGTPLQTLSVVEAPAPSLDDDEVANPQPVSMPVREFLADVTVPGEPFRAYVTGLDRNGTPYQRVISGVTKPQTVIITPPVSQDLVPGRTTSYIVQVKNLGAARGFNLSATDDQGYVQSLDKTFVHLDTNEVADVVVKLQPPADAEVDTLDTLTFAAQGSGDPANASSNFAIITSIVQPVPALDLGTVTATPAAGDGDAYIEPGESGSLSVRLINTGSSTATGINATLSSSTPGVTIVTGESAYPDLVPANGATNTLPFTFNLGAEVRCGQIVEFELLVNTDNEGEPITHNFTVLTGQVSETTGGETVSYTGPPVAIPDSDETGVNIPINVEGLSGILGDLNFRIDGSGCTNAAGATSVGIDHTYAADLVIKLTSPEGTTVTLMNEVGGSGNNFCGVLLDDQNNGDPLSFLGSFQAPFTGEYRPSNPLAAFNGQNPNGTWVLNVSDIAGADIGNVRAFSLILSTLNRTAECDAAPTGTDLSISTITSSGAIVTGSDIVYTSTVTNNGAGNAQAVKVTTALPAEATFVSCDATAGGVCASEGNNRVVTFQSLPAGASATITYVANITCPVADAAVLTSTSTISSATTDTDPSNNSSTATVTASNPSPFITGVSVDRPDLWPPNHKMVDVTVNYDVTDNCGPLTNTLSVTSNEPVNGTGDGDTSPDWEILDAHRVRLRAERSGSGNGRTYTITITSTDSASYSSSHNVTVHVPKSRR